MKVLIGIPARDKKLISTYWHDWMKKIYDDLDKTTIEYSVEYAEGMYYDTARNHLVDFAVKNGFDYILFIDDDIFMPVGGIQQLLSHKKRVTAFPGYAKQIPLKSNIFPNFYFTSLAKIPKDTLMKVDWVGTGCMLINTNIFEYIEKPYFGSGVSIFDEIKGINIDYKTSEDEYFCRKLKKANIDVWVDTTAVCEHYCDKQKGFYPSLSLLDEKGNVVFGGLFNIWEEN